MHPANGAGRAGEPLQADLDAAPIRHGRWMLSPRATYDITARVLAREDYRFDSIADLVPEDLALGWGPMSDNSVLAHFDVSQEVRFYTWRPRDALPIAREAVISHSANTHVIPADQNVRAQLARLRIGQVVHLTVSWSMASATTARGCSTSLTRTDSGPGACEVMLVDSVEVR